MPLNQITKPRTEAACKYIYIYIYIYIKINNGSKGSISYDPNADYMIGITYLQNIAS